MEFVAQIYTSHSSKDIVVDSIVSFAGFHDGTYRFVFSTHSATAQEENLGGSW